ncbi:MAG: 50S ribosomal protein L18e [Methanocellales archaeon]|nr:50S ribosomal protein L18e [Methanocellales archaeon]MDI6903412.1 50S ribosomal protein L18e [Methanocellales archaeon]
MVKTNPRLVKLIEELKAKSREEEVAIWRDIAKRLERPTRNYAEVNVGRINRHAVEGETVLVPGKVLGSGVLDHPVTVAALDFSLSARDKITNVKGKCITIEQLVEVNPSGKGVRIIQ